MPLDELVESVLAETNPRATLVWRKGFADWTRAEDVPEIELRITPVLSRQEEEAAARRAERRDSPSHPVAQPSPAPTLLLRVPPLLYGGIAAGVAVVLLAAWLLWRRSEVPQPLPLGGTTADNAPAIVVPGPGDTTPPATEQATREPSASPTVPSREAARPAARPTPQAASAGAARPTPEHEAEIPSSELGRLRQVAAWSGTTLELTVYNGSRYRVTEIYVAVQRFTEDDLIEDAVPIRLLPPEQGVDAGVASLLDKVAPDRAKPGVNPLDTGKFVGQAGPRPEAYRCEIVSAKGYAFH